MPDNQTDPTLTTDSQLVNQRLLAQRMLEQASQPVQGYAGNVAVSPFQGLGPVINTLNAKQMLKDSTAQEQARLSATGKALSSETTDPASQTQQGPLTTPPPGPQSSLINNLLSATAKNETANEHSPYAAIGQPVLNRQTGQLDKAYGKYQIMGVNIPSWSQEALGTPMTPEQFLANPEAQERVAAHKLGQYAAMYGPEGALRAWYGGEKAVNHPEYRDLTHPNAPNVGQYGRNGMATMAALGTPGIGPQAINPVGAKIASAGPGLPTGALQPPAAAGSPAPTAAPAGGMLAMGPPAPGGSPPSASPAPAPTQVAAGPQGLPPVVPPAPNMSAPAVAPTGQGGAAPGQVAPGFFAQRPHITQQAYQAIMTSQAATPQQKEDARQTWLGQNQPTTFKTQYGTVVMGKDGQQQFIGDPVDMNIKTKDGEVPGHGFYNRDGSITIAPAHLGGQSAPQQAAPAPSGAPSGGAQGAAPGPGPGPGPSAGPAEVPSQVAPGPQGPGPQGALPQAMPKFASRETGTTNDAGMLGANPPPPPQAPAVKPEPVAGATPTPQPQGPQTAQNQSIIQPYQRDTINALGDIAAENEMKGSAATKAGEVASKFVSDTMDQGKLAADETRKIQLLEPIMKDSGFYSGVGSPLVLLKNRIVTALGGNPKAAADMEVANKFFNDLNLDALKQRLGGMGQIRVFEGAMVKNANASLDNSPVANQALITYAKAVNQRILDANNMMNDLLEKNHWVPSPAIQAQVINFYKDKPIMTEEAAKAWNEKITADVEKQKNAPAGPMRTAPPGAPPVSGSATPSPAAPGTAPAAAAPSLEELRAERARRQQQQQQPKSQQPEMPL